MRTVRIVNLGTAGFALYLVVDGRIMSSYRHSDAVSAYGRFTALLAL